MERLDSMTTPTEPVDPLTHKPLPQRFLVLGLVAAAAFLYLRVFMLPATPLMAQGDQVLFFARGVRVMHGQVPYRDFFELVTPGTDLLYAAAFRVLGVHTWMMQAWVIVLGIGFCAELTWIAAKLLREPLVLLPALLFLVFDYNSALDPTHHWYSTLAALAAVRVLCGGDHPPPDHRRGSAVRRQHAVYPDDRSVCARRGTDLSVVAGGCTRIQK